MDQKYAHAATPLHHHHHHKKTPRGTKGGDGDQAAGYVAAVSCSDCRFTKQQRSALAPASPGAVIRSLFVSLTRRSTPRSSPSPSAAAADGAAEAEQWRIAAADLSRRLATATRSRDEALEETTRLKHSLAELELKLARLEARVLPTPSATASFPVDAFLRAVSTARAAVRNLARALPTHLRTAAAPAAPAFPNLESFLNRLFHADFELDTDAHATPDPAGRCEANLAAYHAVAALTWEEVLLRGTKHYSEGLSRFCDAKMSEVVASLGWAQRGARAWPEPLLRAFFLAAKGVWGVRLLARSVHPPLPVVRAERGARFDPRFMEDAAAGRAAAAGGRLEPASVKMMVAPGFHVYLAGAGVVKCKVVCFYTGGGRTEGHRDGGSSVAVANDGGVGLGTGSCTDTIKGGATDGPRGDL